MKENWELAYEDYKKGLKRKEIAEKYGFSDYKYFLKYFKYHEGISPTEYRQTYYNLHMNNN